MFMNTESSPKKKLFHNRTTKFHPGHLLKSKRQRKTGKNNNNLTYAKALQTCKYKDLDPIQLYKEHISITLFTHK